MERKLLTSLILASVLLPFSLLQAAPPIQTYSGFCTYYHDNVEYANLVVHNVVDCPVVNPYPHVIVGGESESAPGIIERIISGEFNRIAPKAFAPPKASSGLEMIDDHGCPIEIERNLS